jgi:hypothetical protein
VSKPEISLPNYLEKSRLINGWPVAGLFVAEKEIHGLVFNKYINEWFHVWWDLQGKCLLPNAGQRFDLTQ